MSSSPGPAIVNLPTTIGEEQHDPTRPKAPGYKIGQRILEDKGQGIRPGPGTYCIHNVTNKGKGAVFAPKFGRAKHFNEKFAGYGGSPKPETYKRDSEEKLFYPRAPTYSMPHAERNKTKIGIGAPNLQRTQQSLDNLPFRTWNNSSTHVQSHVTPTSSFIPSCSPWLPNKLQPLQPSYNRLSWNTSYEAAPTNMAMQGVKNSVGACGPLGGILEYKGQGIEPCPGTYCIRDVTNNGKGAVIAPKFDPAKRFNEKLAGYGGSTGPAVYKRDSAGKLIYPGAPTYSVPHTERRKTKIETVPSPNANNLPPLLGKGGTLDIKGPKYSFGKDERMRKAKLEQVACKKHADCRYHKKKKK